MSVFTNYYFNFYAIPVGVAAIAVLALGVIVFLQNTRSRTNFFFVLSCLSVFIWLSGFSIVYSSKDSSVALSWYKYYVQLGVITIAPNIYFFVKALTKSLKNQKHLLISVYSMAFIFYLLGFNSNFVIGAIKYFWGWYPLFGPLSYLFFIFFFVLMLVTFHRLLSLQGKMKLAIENKRIKIVFSAILVGYAAALDFIPTFKIELYPFGYINIFLWILCMGYAVVKYKFMILTPAVVADQVISLIPDFLILVDREGKITMANQAITSALGYKEDELIKKPVEVIIPQKDTVKSLLSGLGSDGTVINLEATYMSKNGKEMPVIFSRAVIRNNIGDIVGFVIAALDITERKETENRLRDIQFQQRAILNNIPDIAWLKDKEGRFIMVNEPFGKFCGVRPQDIVGKTDFDIWPNDVAQRYAIYDREVMMTGKRKSLEEPLTEKEGKKLIVETVRMPIYNDKGDIIGTAGISRDITELAKEGKRLVQVLEAERKSREVITSMLEDNNQVREKLEKSLEKLRDAQAHLIHAEKMEAVGRMASGVAHEVKNPLGIILQGINYLENALPPDGKDSYDVLQMMKEGVKRADGIVRALLDFSRSQEFEVKPQDINSIIEISLGLVQHKIKGSGVEIVRELNDDLPKLLVDAGKIEQVFINLFNNAIDAMPKGGKLYVRSYLSGFKTPRNKIGNREEDIFRIGEEVVIVEIEDTGAGMDDEILNKIFDPFFTTKNRTEGTGLGLSIAKSIIDIHRGLISVNSIKGKGSKFTIAFKISEEK